MWIMANRMLIVDIIVPYKIRGGCGHVKCGCPAQGLKKKKTCSASVKKKKKRVKSKRVHSPKVVAQSLDPAQVAHKPFETDAKPLGGDEWVPKPETKPFGLPWISPNRNRNLQFRFGLNQVWSGSKPNFPNTSWYMCEHHPQQHPKC